MIYEIAICGIFIIIIGGTVFISRAMIKPIKDIYAGVVKSIKTHKKNEANRMLQEDAIREAQQKTMRANPPKGGSGVMRVFDPNAASGYSRIYSIQGVSGASGYSGSGISGYSGYSGVSASGTQQEETKINNEFREQIEKAIEDAKIKPLENKETEE